MGRSEGGFGNPCRRKNICGGPLAGFKGGSVPGTDADTAGMATVQTKVKGFREARQHA